MVFLFSRIHSDIINTQLRDFSFPLECAFRGRQGHGRTSLSASKPLARPSAEKWSGPWTVGHAGPRLRHPPLCPQLPIQWVCGCLALLPSFCQQLCLSLPSGLYTTTKARTQIHRHTDLHRQTRSQLVTTKHLCVWFSAEQLLSGTPARGEHSAAVAGLKGGVEKGSGQKV